MFGSFLFPVMVRLNIALCLMEAKLQQGVAKAKEGLNERY